MLHYANLLWLDFRVDPSELILCFCQWSRKCPHFNRSFILSFFPLLILLRVAGHFSRPLVILHSAALKALSLILVIWNSRALIIQTNCKRGRKEQRQPIGCLFLNSAPKQHFFLNVCLKHTAQKSRRVPLTGDHINLRS